MQRNRLLTAVLAGGVLVGVASTGYVTAQVTTGPGRSYAGPYQPAANANTAGTAPLPVPSAPSSPTAASVPPSMPAGSGAVFQNAPLAQFIAQKAGTGLAGRAPQDVPVSQVRALSDQAPAGAGIDPRAGTITFDTTAVSFTVVAIAPGKPDMTFTVAGIADPAITVPAGARVTVRFVNNDTDEAHGWLITASRPPFAFGQPATPAIPGAYAGVIGDPTAAGDGASTVAFTAGSPGSYQYICPMPGHAQMGMHGSFTVR
jgi:rusticyanin